MTLQEIAMMKTFTKDRGMDEMFISLYTKYKLKENPLSIEEYLQKVDASNVFVSAFYWLTNTRYGYDYWQDFQRRWDRYRAERIDEYPMEDVRNFKGRAKALRYNWDNPKFWHTQGRMDTAERYGMELSREELEKIAAEYERVGYTKTHEGAGKDLRLAHKELFEREQKERQTEEEFALKNNSNNDPLAEFELADLTANKEGFRRLRDNEITYNVKNKGWRITFNRTITKEIQKRGGYEYATIGRNKKGEVMLMLNDANGVPMQESNRDNATIGSKMLCDRLAEFLDIKDKYIVLKIKEIAKTNDYVAYLVTK